MKQLRLFLLCHSGITCLDVESEFGQPRNNEKQSNLLILAKIGYFDILDGGERGEGEKEKKKKQTQLFIYSLCMFNINEQDSKFGTGLLASALKFSNIVN